ncbi:MAG: hypothetical protein ACOY45_06875 [Pseudomonadota bacterium]
MAFINPVQCSRAWYDFVKEHAIADAEVQKLAADYVEAMNKLNARLTALADAAPELKSFALNDPAEDKGNVDKEFIEAVQEFHAFHGVDYTAEEIAADAAKHGLATVTVS